MLKDQFELVPVKARNAIEARLADQEEKKWLKLPDPSAVLVMRQTSFLADGRPIEYTRSTYMANERFHIEFGPPLLVTKDTYPHSNEEDTRHF